MNRHYRIVFFADPTNGLRLPIGAVLREGDAVRAIGAEQLPGPGCVGGLAASHSIYFMSQVLPEAEDFETLPASIGPNAVLSEAIAVPEQIPDAEHWIRHKVLPTKRLQSGQLDVHRAPHRSVFGKRFLERWQVDKYVHSHFAPGKGRHGWLRSAERTLPSITHWVEGDSELLLLEPLAPNRASLADDIREIGARFHAYRGAVGKSADIATKTRLVAYVTNGGDDESRQRALIDLAGPADEVVDTAITMKAAHLVNSIRIVGESLLGSERLPWES